MKAFQTLWPRPLARISASLAAISLFALLTACGGSGGSPSGSSNTNQSGATTTTLEVGPVTLTGVAAMGAPMLGATVSVVDAKGVLQGSTTTNATDGSYTLALPASNIPLPLLLEANGVDMTGTPVSLHSVVQTATTGTTRITIHVNPATDAVVAMLLGADPAAQFKAASTQASTWTQLGNTTALSSASDLIKTIIKTNLTDAKVTNSAKLDFFQDSSFSANKTGLDGALEGLNIQIGKDSGANPQLEFSNRFRAPGSPEVTIKLSDAKDELAKGSTGKVANAIKSTAKVTTSVTSLITNIGSLDTLSANINQRLAAGYTALMLVTEPIFSNTFYMHDGADIFTVANTLAQYGASHLQLSRFQFTGCADDPMPVSGCAKPLVSALVSDSTGQILGVFNNVVKYSATTGWALQGNGRQSKWTVTGAAWASWDATGQLTASGQGVRFNVIPLIDSLVTTLILPSGHSISMYDCQMTLWCQTNTSVGDLISDYILQSPQLGWFGQQDATRGARYQLSGVSILVPGGELSTVYLPNDVPTGTAASTYPLPDGLSNTALSCADIYAGIHVTWSAWAAANPTMRMLSVRSIVTAASQAAPWVQTATVNPVSANVTDVPAVTSPPATPTACQLWMVAQDTQGHQFISKIVAP